MADPEENRDAALLELLEGQNLNTKKFPDTKSTTARPNASKPLQQDVTMTHMIPAPAQVIAGSVRTTVDQA